MATALLPPGPQGHFLTGNLSELRQDWLGCLTRYVQQYGDVVPLRLGPKQAVLLNRPDLIEAVLVTKSRNFIKSPILRNGRRLLGNGLLVSEGDFWRRQRRLAQPGFHRQRIAAYGETMVTYSLEMLDDWHDGQVRDVRTDMMGLTLKIVAQTLFGADVAGLTAEVEAAMAIAVERFNDRMGSLQFLLPDSLPLPGNLGFLRAARRLDAIIFGIIEQRRRSGEDPGDLLSMLLAVRDDDGSQMTDRQLRDEVMTLFLAGHETTAVALSWIFWLLAQHPEVEQRLLAELSEALGRRPATVDDLPALTYAESVVSESMRLYPPVWAVAREALQACEIGEYRVPSGAIVVMPQWTVQRDRRWFDEPLEFRPQRWLDGLARRLPKFAYFPFGGGPRQCIGNGFAMMEAVLVLATIAPRWRLELVPGHPVVPWPSVTLRPREGVQVTVRRRGDEC